MNITSTVNLYPPTKGCHIPWEEDYQKIIQSALKADHQVYTLDKLRPFIFTDVPSVPGPLNILSCPFSIVKNLAILIKNKVKGFHGQKVEAGVKITTDAANLVNSAFIVLGYITALHLVAIATTVILPVILATGFVFSIVELCLNIFHVYQDKEFKEKLTVALLKEMQVFIKTIKKDTFDKDEVFSKATFLLHKVESEYKLLENTYSKQYVKNLHKELLSFCKNFDAYQKDPHLVRKKAVEIYTCFLKEFCTRNLSSIADTYLVLSPAEKRKWEIKAEKNRNTFGKEKGLLLSLKGIQETFRKKKISLARRVEAKTALEFVNRYHHILENIHSKKKEAQGEGIHEAAKMLLKIYHNAKVNTSLHITGCITYSLIILSYIVTLAFPLHTLLAMILITTASLYSIGCHLIRKGYLESKDNHFDFYNCIPKFLQPLGKKLQAFFQTKPIQAVDLTASLAQKRTA